MQNRRRGCLSEGLTFWRTLTKSNRRFPLPTWTKQRRSLPSLIIHGNKDRLVPFGQSVLFLSAIEAKRQICGDV